MTTKIGKYDLYPHVLTLKRDGQHKLCLGYPGENAYTVKYIMSTELLIELENGDIVPLAQLLEELQTLRTKQEQSNWIEQFQAVHGGDV